MLTTSYSDFQSQLNRVRAAWKRAAAIQGLAIVTIEAIGMFLLFLLLPGLLFLLSASRQHNMRLSKFAKRSAQLIALGRHQSYNQRNAKVDDQL